MSGRAGIPGPIDQRDHRGVTHFLELRLLVGLGLRAENICSRRPLPAASRSRRNVSSGESSYRRYPLQKCLQLALRTAKVVAHLRETSLRESPLGGRLRLPALEVVAIELRQQVLGLELVSTTPGLASSPSSAITPVFCATPTDMLVMEPPDHLVHPSCRVLVARCPTPGRQRPRAARRSERTSPRRRPARGSPGSAADRHRRLATGSPRQTAGRRRTAWRDRPDPGGRRARLRDERCRGRIFAWPQHVMMVIRRDGADGPRAARARADSPEQHGGYRGDDRGRSAHAAWPARSLGEPARLGQASELGSARSIRQRLGDASSARRQSRPQRAA